MQYLPLNSDVSLFGHTAYLGPYLHNPQPLDWPQGVDSYEDMRETMRKGAPPRQPAQRAVTDPVLSKKKSVWQVVSQAPAPLQHDNGGDAHSESMPQTKSTRPSSPTRAAIIATATSYSSAIAARSAFANVTPSLPEVTRPNAPSQTTNSSFRPLPTTLRHQKSQKLNNSDQPSDGEALALLWQELKRWRAARADKQRELAAIERATGRPLTAASCSDSEAINALSALLKRKFHAHKARRAAYAELSGREEQEPDKSDGDMLLGLYRSITDKLREKRVKKEEEKKQLQEARQELEREAEQREQHERWVEDKLARLRAKKEEVLAKRERESLAAACMDGTLEEERDLDTRSISPPAYEMRPDYQALLAANSGRREESEDVVEAYHRIQMELHQKPPTPAPEKEHGRQPKSDKVDSPQIETIDMAISRWRGLTMRETSVERSYEWITAAATQRISHHSRTTSSTSQTWERSTNSAESSNFERPDTSSSKHSLWSGQLSQHAGSPDATCKQGPDISCRSNSSRQPLGLAVQAVNFSKKQMTQLEQLSMSRAPDDFESVKQTLLSRNLIRDHMQRSTESKEIVHGKRNSGSTHFSYFIQETSLSPTATDLPGSVRRVSAEDIERATTRNFTQRDKVEQILGPMFAPLPHQRKHSHLSNYKESLSNIGGQLSHVRHRLAERTGEGLHTVRSQTSQSLQQVQQRILKHKSSVDSDDSSASFHCIGLSNPDEVRDLEGEIIDSYTHRTPQMPRVETFAPRPLGSPIQLVETKNSKGDAMNFGTANYHQEYLRVQQGETSFFDDAPDARARSRSQEVDASGPPRLVVRTAPSTASRMVCSGRFEYLKTIRGGQYAYDAQNPTTVEKAYVPVRQHWTPVEVLQNAQRRKGKTNMYDFETDSEEEGGSPF